MRSARLLAAQAASMPRSVSAQTPSGMPGWLCSPGRKRVPVQNVFLDDGAPSPTVGAKCRGYRATYARGWLIMDGDKSTSPGSRSGSERDRIRLRILPRSVALLGDNTPSPSLRGLRMMTMINKVATSLLLELFRLEEEEGQG